MAHPAEQARPNDRRWGWGGADRGEPLPSPAHLLTSVPATTSSLPAT